MPDRAVITNAASPVPARAAPAWRRLWAFVLDLVLIAVAGNLVGRVWFDPINDLGAVGRLIGFGLVVGYFAIFDSAWGGGRSIGKRLFGICVVRADGASLAPVPAGIRAALITAPVVLNGMTTSASAMQALLNLAVVGLGLSIVYLAGVNRVLHDLPFGTLVVRNKDRAAGRPPPAEPPLWRGHLAIVGAIMLASVLYPFIAPRFVDIGERERIERDGARLPFAGTASVELHRSRAVRADEVIE